MRLYNKQSGIYKIVDLATQKFYIGSAVNIAKRWTQHMSSLKKGKHCNRHLQSIFDKRGIENLSFVLLEFCEKKSLIEREQHYIDSLNPEINICPVAASVLGRKFTEETKKRMSEIAKKKGRKPSKECLEASIEAQKKLTPYWTGKKRSEETKAKIRASKQYVSLETREKLSKANKGKKKPPISEETRKKLSIAAKKRGMPDYLLNKKQYV